MSRFLKRTLLFLSILLGIFSFFFISLEFLNYKIAKSQPVGNSITKIFIGDSHIQQCINDSLLENSINIGQNSESIYFSYHKIKLLLESNPSIKEVYLGFSYHSISSYYEKFIDGEYSNAISSKYFALLPLKEKISIIYANKTDLISYFKALIDSEIKNIFNDRKSYQGSYENVFFDSKVNHKSVEKRIQFQYYTEDSLNPYSQSSIESVNKINDLCKKSNVKLILLNTPVHKSYKEKVPNKFKSMLIKLANDMKVRTLDLSDLLSEENLFIPDGDHVSQQGARLTTEYIRKTEIRNKGSN